ncbi:DUF1385 domain-containing protein [Desulforamulus hydrothermalis]|uniref:DUF1385 domain-containing protein n=1 Tax=Desulforamulus hydrothermalis Lam5 = DSM 18033 TaxID=1121428 RepID=K8DZK2_9FIRM|nr:DUF1385 domain-containing protein [Desulforamulus hydrothermalis]CCO08415.1 conserved membrane hypothetical protein [Desulforamulus hydrothermalis Lam5 = DSM 18033]SHH14932.1 Uncharacterized conserved protein YqhQ [Desulforamulus hydrothermalis Lam5 = DSM 18033]
MSFQYGGQAVIEGVMMRGPDHRAVAVRRPDATIVIDEKPVGSLTRRFAFLKLPFVRGVVMLFESLMMGLEALAFSAEQAAGEEPEEKISKWEMFLTIAFSLGLAILLFIVIPTALTYYTAAAIQDNFIRNLVEGAIRLLIFLGYVAGVARLPDIRRVFMYHGAEHKVINAYEAGGRLTVEEVQKFSTLHPRCGTSFLLIVILIKVVIFSGVTASGLFGQIFFRILLLPVVAGVAYELLKLSGKYQDRGLCRIFIAPGLWLQKLTTREPDDSQVEVAIKAFKAVRKEGDINVS